MALADIQHDYLALTRRRRIYGGLLVVIFVAMMVSGFRVADGRNAGGFWQGLHQVGDFPAALIGEAIEKAGNLPGHMVNAIPAMIETLNIAIVATLLGCMAGGALAMAATRGLARWPRLVPVAR
ncbi:phosphonate ABC transporter, permease protein PhnE, partial [Paracoccus liaowanqingii]